MEEKKECKHSGFIEEYEDRYFCTNCKETAIKVIQTGIHGLWVDGNEPEEIKKQHQFEKALQIQKENKLKREI